MTLQVILLFWLVILMSNYVDSSDDSGICKALCYLNCPGIGWCGACKTIACLFACNKACSKRDIVTKSDIVPLPCYFDNYDYIKDGHISPEELGKIRGGHADDEDVQKLFKRMDLDGDGKITPREFEAAPLFKMCGNGKGVTKRVLGGGDREEAEEAEE